MRASLRAWARSSGVCCARASRRSASASSTARWARRSSSVGSSVAPSPLSGLSVRRTEHRDRSGPRAATSRLPRAGDAAPAPLGRPPGGLQSPDAGSTTMVCRLWGFDELSSGFRIAKAVFGALAQVAPDRVFACEVGGHGHQHRRLRCRAAGVRLSRVPLRLVGRPANERRHRRLPQLGRELLQPVPRSGTAERELNENGDRAFRRRPPGDARRPGGAPSPHALARRGRGRRLGLRHEPRLPAGGRGVLAHALRLARAGAGDERVPALPRERQWPRRPLHPRARPGAPAAPAARHARLAELVRRDARPDPTPRRPGALAGILQTRSTWSCPPCRASGSRTARFDGA